MTAIVRRTVDALPQGNGPRSSRAISEGLTQAEAAAALGLPVGALKTRLYKARASLRHTLWAAWGDATEEMRSMQTANPATTDDFVDVRVMDVRGRPISTDQPFRNIVLLEEIDGERVLPI